MIIDTHAHLDFKNFRKDLPDVVKRARAVGVEKIVTIGIDLETSEKAITIAREFENVFATVGIHPHEADSATSENIETLETLASEPEVVAIGECGLDYVKSETTREEQFHAFRDQIKLAEKLSLPLVVHSRESYEDTYDILSEFKGSVRGIIHCMSGDALFRDKVLEMGFYIAIGGPLTYPDNDKLRETISGIPLDRLLVETDCPFLVPQARRPGRNEPAFLVEVVETLASLYGTTTEKIESATTANAIKILDLPE